MTASSLHLVEIVVYYDMPLISVLQDTDSCQYYMLFDDYDGKVASLLVPMSAYEMTAILGSELPMNYLFSTGRKCYRFTSRDEEVIEGQIGDDEINNFEPIGEWFVSLDVTKEADARRNES